MDHELQAGEVLIPELLANGMQTKIGDTIVLVANNKAGSVNGINVKVGGIVGQITGPGGKDGFITLEDAKKVLRMGNTFEVSEVIVRLKDLGKLKEAQQSLSAITKKLNKSDKPAFEMHTWEQLSPFYNIVKMLDIMNLSIKIILISIVLISILNVMVMSVYERVREIGTIAAMGTRPSVIVKLFLAEGLMLGVFGAIVGSLLSFGVVFILNMVKITYDFGRETGLVLSPSLGVSEALSVSVIVVVISLIASLSPALKASRLNPVDALRTF
jgi:putative ABC transport system permease protein